MTDLSDMGFGLHIETIDGSEFNYSDPDDIGFGGDGVMQVKFEGGARHHFDVAELESVVLVKTEDTDA